MAAGNDPTIADIDAAIAAQSKPSIADIDAAIQVQGGAKPASWLDRQILGHTPRNVIQSGLNALPTVGMVGGSLVGGAAATPETLGAGTIPGAVAGAAGGSALGEAAKNLGEQYILGQDKTRSDIYGNPVKGAIEGATNEMGGRLIGLGAGAAANSKPGQYLIDKVAQAGSKIGSTFTGIPQKVLETYASDPQGINQIAADANYSPQKMADGLREEINAHVQNTRKQLGQQLSDSFSNRAGQTVDSKPIIDALNSSKLQINAKLRPEEIDQVDDMISKVKSLSDGSGQLQLKDASDLKSWLQEQAQGSYSKNGQIFQNGSMAQKAAKVGGAMARRVVNTAAPEVAQANDTLSQLHDLEDTMNRNMLAEGKTGSSLYSAGSGENEANEMHLKELGDITGHDFLGAARKIAAAKQFGKAAVLPVDSTGKSLTRIGAAGALGYAVGHAPGAVIAEGIASPLGTKGLINAGSMASQAVQGTSKYAPSLIGKGLSNLNPENNQ
jgi:hypothetical protein